MSKSGSATASSPIESLTAAEKKQLRTHLEEFRLAAKSERVEIIYSAYLELGQTLASKKARRFILGSMTPKSQVNH